MSKAKLLLEMPMSEPIIIDKKEVQKKINLLAAIIEGQDLGDPVVHIIDNERSFLIDLISSSKPAITLPSEAEIRSNILDILFESNGNDFGTDSITNYILKITGK